jgi:Lipocalin-like domain
MRVVGLFCILLIAASPAFPSDNEQRLLGMWKVESWYTEFKATGEKKSVFGERPNGYLIFTPEKRMLALLTAEQRKKPETDEDRVAAFRSMAAYSGIYRVEGDRWITKVDIAWTEAWMGTEQMRLFKVEGDTLTVSTPWQPSPNLPGNPEIRHVLVWSRVKATR